MSHGDEQSEFKVLRDEIAELRRLISGGGSADDSDEADDECAAEAEGLREEIATLRTLFNAFPDLYCVLDSDGVLIDVQAGSGDLPHPALDDFMGGSLGEVFVPPYDELFRDCLRETVDGAVVPFEYRLDVDGQVHWFECRLRLLRADRIVAAIREVTDRRRAEDEVRAQKEWLSVTLKGIGEGVISTDATGAVMLMNPVAERLTGVPLSEARGRPLDEVLSLIDERTRARRTSPVQRVLRLEREVGLATPSLLIARSGREISVADTAAPIRDDTGQIIGVVIVFRDVTEERALQREQQRTQQLEALSILASGIAHDFNNVLTAVVGNLTLARMGTTVDGDALVDAEAAALRARALTAQLLTFAKEGAPVTEAAPAAEIVRDTVAFALRGSKVSAAIDIEGDLPKIQVDVSQISTSLTHILLNAVQAMPDGGRVEVTARHVRVTAAGGDTVHTRLKPGQYVEIGVRDRGVGIAEEHLERVFDPYFTTKQRGSGLGLATSRAIVERHGGAVAVESALGEGSVFWLYVPVSGEASEQDEVEPDAMESAEGDGLHRVLVMDDDASVCRVLGRLISSLGYRVDTAINGREAVSAFEAARAADDAYDIAILDVTVPGEGGAVDVLASLRAIDPTIAAIVSSGYAAEPAMKTFEQHGFQAGLPKPYSRDEVAAALKRAMNATVAAPKR